MTAIKLLSATLIFAAASSAFAGTDDGNVPNSFQIQTAAVRQAPAPVAAAAAKSTVSKSAGNQDFTSQQAETSGN